MLHMYSDIVLVCEYIVYFLEMVRHWLSIVNDGDSFIVGGGGVM